VNIAGATGSENLYVIDGVNTTDPYLAESSTRLPLNFIKQVELKVGGYEAEYGRSSGGIINVITHSGSNEFQASGFGYFTNNSFTAAAERGPLQYEQDAFGRYDFGLSVGGPIARDNLWYFFAYDRTSETEDLDIPGFGVHRDEKTINQFAGKLTWRAGSRTRVDLMGFGDPTDHYRVGPNWLTLDTPDAVANIDVLLGNWTSGSYTVALNAEHFLGDNMLLEGSVYRFDGREKAEPATEIGLNEQTYIDYSTGIWSGGYQNIFDNRSTRTAARLAATLVAENHNLKAGLEYEDNRLDTDYHIRTPDGKDGWVEKYPDTTYASILFVQEGQRRNRIPTVYAQDAWRATRRFQINAGLRWDGLYLIGTEGEVIQSVDDQFQPRLGLSYEIGELGTQKIFGAVGRFYEQVPTFVTTFSTPFTQMYVAYDDDPVTNYPLQGDTLFTIIEGASTSQVDDLKGQHYDEIGLGYERRLGQDWKVVLNGLHREYREIIEDVLVPVEILGNPGRDELDYLPDPVHRYSALELSVQRVLTERYHLAASYVLSRTYGNHSGVFYQDQGVGNSNAGPAYNCNECWENAEGLLPNDRTHVFKLYGAYAWDFGLSAGTFFTWQSGTPLSEFGTTFQGLYNIVPRGTVGRTPSFWDLNLRVAYDLSRLTGPEKRFRSKIILDVFHLFSQRQPLALDQTHFFTVDDEGNPAGENPSYLEPLIYQPPTVVRLGLEAGF
jgi:hypothetical protein